jgi:hypothetical protein
MDTEFFDAIAQSFWFGVKLVRNGWPIFRRINSALTPKKDDLMQRVADLQQKADQFNHQGQPRDQRKFVAKINRPQKTL